MCLLDVHVLNRVSPSSNAMHGALPRIGRLFVLLGIIGFIGRVHGFFHDIFYGLPSPREVGFLDDSKQ